MLVSRQKIRTTGKDRKYTHNPISGHGFSHAMTQHSSSKICRENFRQEWLSENKSPSGLSESCSWFECDMNPSSSRWKQLLHVHTSCVWLLLSQGCHSSALYTILHITHEQNYKALRDVPPWGRKHPARGSWSALKYTEWETVILSRS